MQMFLSVYYLRSVCNKKNYTHCMVFCISVSVITVLNVIDVQEHFLC